MERTVEDQNQTETLIQMDIYNLRGVTLLDFTLMMIGQRLEDTRQVRTLRGSLTVKQEVTAAGSHSTALTVGRCLVVRNICRLM